MAAATIGLVSTSITRTGPRRWFAALAAAVVLGAGALAGCGSDGASSSCSLDRCTVTFDRDAEGGTRVLGVRVELVEATDRSATVSVGGQEVAVPVDDSRQIAGLTVEVRSITADEVVVVVSR
jgi:hypothetical protein